MKRPTATESQVQQGSMIKLTIPGEPCAKQRPRVCKWGTYTPAKTVNYETFIKELFAISGQQKLNGPLVLTIYAYFSIPKSDSKKTRQAKLSGEILPAKKPDVDNLIKIVADALNGLAYDDDAQIVSATIKKVYGENPMVHVYVQRAMDDIGVGANA